MVVFRCENSGKRVPKNICFTDYAKAFHYVLHNILWKILKQMGIPDPLTCLLRNLCAGQEAKVRTGHGKKKKKRTGHGTTDRFQIGKGVHQGCILSPCLASPRLARPPCGPSCRMAHSLLRFGSGASSLVSLLWDAFPLLRRSL